MSLLELATLCEAATKRDEWELLTRAYDAIFGKAHAIPIATWPGHKMPDRWEEFRGMLNANAFLDAAMALVPETHCGQVQFGKHPGAWVEPLSEKNPSDFNMTATPALGVCAAALKARAASVGRNPQGEDRADGLRRNDEHAVAATGGETPEPGSRGPDNG